MRAVWKGSIRFSLVTVPVEAYTAAAPEEGIRLNQLHAKCHNRIRYKKVCPVHGEVPPDEIVSGYEYEKDRYVIVDRRDAKDEQASDRSINIDTFTLRDAIDPVYFDGRSYYLAPAKGVADKPYSVLRDAMAKMNRWGVGTVVLNNRESLVALRPLDDVLVMMFLQYKHSIRSPELLKDKLPSVKGNQQELKLAQQLIEATTDRRFDLERFEDSYGTRLRALIDAKIAGEEGIVLDRPAAMPPVVNFMDALKKSIRGTNQPARKKASRHIPQTRRRKSS